MSAQIITALRKRAEAIDAEADALMVTGQMPADERGAYRSVAPLRMIGAEFRALADEAEAP